MAEADSIEKRGKFPSVIFSIFGGSGDLTWRKLIPSLFNLFRAGKLPSKFAVIILDRAELKSEELREKFRDGVNKFSGSRADDASWKEFADRIHYIQGEFNSPGLYGELKEKCRVLESEWNTEGQYVFYMATPPKMFEIIPPQLKKADLAKHNEKARIVIEKPIGSDLTSARRLNKILTDNFRESQIFRIDHYLGKETVQNILAFRFANPVFEPIWNRRYVDFISITVAEDIGIGHRGSYYDSAGALRDMIQNHLLQIVCLIAMEPMVSFDADEIRNKKVDVLHAVRAIPYEKADDFAVRGQYGPGMINGELVAGYREEPGVSPESNTETFAALKLFVDNWRWQDVPFYIRTGKRLSSRYSEIYIHFRPVPHKSFPLHSISDWVSPSLTIAIQPYEGIELRFLAKQPGMSLQMKPVAMSFNYHDSFRIPIPDAYETLLWDVINDDATLFMRSDQVEAAWQIIMPVLQSWSDIRPENFPDYKAGTTGPVTAHLLEKDHFWPDIAENQKNKEYK